MLQSDVKKSPSLTPPGHADSVAVGAGPEDGRRVLLLVDAFEGAMPQTRFVLGKASGPEAHRGGE
jgi:predicted membrane GTPase involved in stress response